MENQTQYNGFYGEDQAIEFFQEDPAFGWKGIMNHSTAEIRQDYQDWCRQQHLDPEQESSAMLFSDYREQLFEESMCN